MKYLTKIQLNQSILLNVANLINESNIKKIQ